MLDHFRRQDNIFLRLKFGTKVVCLKKDVITKLKTLIPCPPLDFLSTFSESIIHCLSVIQVQALEEKEDLRPRRKSPSGPAKTWS